MPPVRRTWDDTCLEDLAVLVSEEVLERGRACLLHGRVEARLAAGNRLAGAVLGTNGWYTATAALEEHGIVTTCTCPYQGPVCKHAVALVLSRLAEPGAFLDLQGPAGPAALDPEELRRLCLELCLAAPREAIRLLQGREAGANAEAAAHAAAGLLVHPHAFRDPESLAERLAWVGGKLLPAVSAGDAGALRAALELAERLLAAWEEGAADAPLADPIGRYLRDLAAAWPAEGPEEARARLRQLCRPTAVAFGGELGRLLRAAGERTAPAGMPPVVEEIFRLLSGGPSSPVVKTVSMESLLLLLDAYERWGSTDEAAALARAALRRPDETERYVFRRRLAGYHAARGERRQALAYLTANFLCRPDVPGWVELRRAALAAGEWERVWREIRPAVLAAPVGLRVQAALDEGDRELLLILAPDLAPDEPRAVAVWSAAAEIDPELGFALLAEEAWRALADGGRAARRRAADCLRALARVCRARGWEERWEQVRVRLGREFPNARGWPELGALLGRGEGPG